MAGPSSLPGDSSWSVGRSVGRSLFRTERIDHRRSADVPCLARRELARAELLCAPGIGTALDRGAVRDSPGPGHFALHAALLAQQHALLGGRSAARVAGEHLLARRWRIRRSRGAEVPRHHHRLWMAREGQQQQHRHRGEDDDELLSLAPSRSWLLRQVDDSTSKWLEVNALVSGSTDGSIGPGAPHRLAWTGAPRRRPRWQSSARRS